MDNNTLSPAILDTIHQAIVSHFSNAYLIIGGYASNLFYLLAVIELTLFGLMWAIRQDALWGEFLFKIIKLGMVFFIIHNYPYLLQMLINGFTDIALHSHDNHAGMLFFNPASIWQYGFDASISLINLSVQYGTPNISLALLYLILGFGTLVLFGLIGAEVLVLTAAFYVVSLLALLLIPFGVLSITKHFLEQAIYGVMHMGARIFALIMVLGIGVAVWSNWNLPAINQTTNLAILLGFFFATLVIFILSIKVPKLAAMVVGKVSGAFVQGVAQAGASVSTSAALTVTGMNNPVTTASTAVAAGSGMNASTAPTPNAMQAATAISVGSNSNAATVPGVVTVSGNSPLLAGNNKIGKGTHMGQGLSTETLNKLKTTFKQALREHK